MFGQIFCLANCNHSEERWVSKTSIRVKKQFHKNKYQMPNIEELMDTVEKKTISERKTGMYFFLRWILHTLMASYHLVQKRVYNAIFR